jgi:hypothetical protein
VRVFPQAESKLREDCSGQFGGRDLALRGEAKMKATDTGDVNVAPEDKRPMTMVLLDRDGMGAARGCAAPHLLRTRAMSHSFEWRFITGWKNFV